MPIKDILVALSPRDEQDPGRDYALAMARHHSAHLTAAAYAVTPDAPRGIYPDFVLGLTATIQDAAEAAVKGARERFEHAAQQAGVRHGFHGASRTLMAVKSDFAKRARTSDIVILTQHNPGAERSGDVFLQAALFQSGRPVIVVPRGFSSGFGTRRVLIAWDGSAQAARAVAGAMPLLDGASIEVFSAFEESKTADIAGSHLVDHLRRHDLDVGLKELTVPDIPSAIISEAEAFGASLIVMGGYAHSRLGEFIFGGVTRDMLKNMEVPVLMAH